MERNYVIVTLGIHILLLDMIRNVSESYRYSHAIRESDFGPAAVNMSCPTLAMRRRGAVSPAERGVLSVFRGRAAAFRNHISYRLRSVTGTALGRARRERKCAENCDKRHSKVS